MPGCGHCGAAVEVVAGQVGRRDVCAECGGELRSCVCCRHYDTQAAKGCREPQAEVPRARHTANFCEYFQIGDGGQHGEKQAATLSAAEALFKKR
ncbi:MAG: hypothetical protein ACKVPX_13595 [Myxococcaceae bacterium]